MGLKISIITISYNEAAHIVATMESVFAQTYRNIEYIVQDGGSTDGTVEKIKKFESVHHSSFLISHSSFAFHWESARDGGLYHGMNAGLAKCTGDYVLFCNAGDRLASNDVIEKLVSTAENWQNVSDTVCQHSPHANLSDALVAKSSHGCGRMPHLRRGGILPPPLGKGVVATSNKLVQSQQGGNLADSDCLPDLVYGDCEDVLNGQHLIRPAHGPHFMKCGMPASHEAMLYKLSLIRKLGLKYDPTYRIAADYKFTYQFVNAAKSFAYAPVPVVVFSDGGVSTANKWQGLMEANRARKEVSGLSLPTRLAIILMQCAALFLSTYCAPLYRTLRLRKRQAEHIK